MSPTVTDLNKRRASGRMAASLYRRDQGLSAAEAAILDGLADEFRGRRILDIGVGAGPSTPPLLQISRDYVGIDYSPAMIDLSRQRHSEVDFQLCDARDLSRFADGTFDLIVFYGNGIDYVAHADRQKILAEIRRVCAVNGVFVLSAHNLLALGKVSPISMRPVSPLRPWQMLRRCGGFAIRHFNHSRLKAREVRAPGYAIVNNGTLRELLLYFVDPQFQIEQLQQHGFTDIRLVDQRGRELHGPEDRESIWIYYIARKGLPS